MRIFKPMGGHAGDTFREVIDMWEEAGYCTVEPSPDNYVWAGQGPGDILLYDHPRIDDREPPYGVPWKGIPEFNAGLFGNTVPKHEKIVPWIFWARRPKLLWERHNKGLPTYQNRHIESIFLGKVENQVQAAGRVNHDWSDAIELFSMPVDNNGSMSGKWPFTQEEYLEKLAHSKFGLCLPGYGPKCNREIEYMGLGVVPLVGPGVDLQYYNSWHEGTHYIRVDHPDHVLEKTQGISMQKWKAMSEQCVKWYTNNCSPRGSYETTVRIIDRLP